MDIARVVASRATCDRKHVGALIVRDRTILSSGYNGSIRGMPHCSEVGHMMEDGHCVATIHAESNAILQAAKNGVHIDGGTVYVTASPCWSCFKHIANSGLRRIVFGEFYRDPRIFDVARRLGIDLAHLAEGDDEPRMASEPTDGDGDGDGEGGGHGHGHGHGDGSGAREGEGVGAAMPGTTESAGD